MNLNKLTGARLKAEREEKNVKQEAIAKKLHISQSKVSKIENGKAAITLTIVTVYCEILQITIHELIGDLSNWF